jgi:hypothetical protein
MKKLKKENAIRICLYIDKDVYKRFRLKSIMLNKSTSILIEELMKKEI